MKKKFLTLNVLIFIGLIIYLILPGKIETRFENKLQEFGFPHANIEKTTLGFKTVIFQNITLDKDGQNKIKRLKAKGNWLSFVTGNNIKTIEITGLDSTSKINRPSPLLWLKNKSYLERIHALPIDKITIEDAKFNLIVKNKQITLNSRALVQQKDADKDITFTLKSASSDLDLDSHWTATLKQNAMLQLNSDIKSVKFHSDPLKINRGAGWLSFDTSTTPASISGQLEAGSGDLLDTPIKNISFLIGQSDDSYPLLFRADASGVDGVELAADLDLTGSSEDYKFTTSLNIKNGKDFIDYMQTTHEKDLSGLRNINSLDNAEILLTYLSERRFSDGPLPFELSIVQKENEILNGHVLIYPKSLDVRGTAQTYNGIKDLLIPLLNIPSEKISGDVIRLDGNISNILKQ